ncbi:NAD(P)-binding protein [Violaceomyces palustris]|uniref:NAD(P)-binding protein n=1 Tax=Violaceomyces palustris TaxID=1673888 RepID=A0ACD0NSU4_9BASI|nr:NAD(P)-binding protein [Violaceomyces palustris]
MSNPRTVLVWGANGVSGIAAVKALLDRPKTEIDGVIAVSRRPAQIPNKDERYKFLSIDLLNAEVEEVIEKLNQVGGQQVDTALHYTYIEKKDQQELTDINMVLLKKALDATVGAAGKKFRHFHLQTGYKWYSLHLGDPKRQAPLPYREDAERGPTDPPNFYYHQVDALIEHAKRHGYQWSETRPNTIIGAAKGNFMNQGVSTSLFFALEKWKGSKEVQYPGNLANWDKIIVDQSTASNNAEFQIWVTDAKNSEKCANQSFNIHDGGEKTLGQIWKELGDYHGIKVLPPLAEAKVVEGDRPPILSMSLDKWSKDAGNLEAWRKLTSERGGDPEAFESHATFAFADFTLGATFEQNGSLDKAREAGWGRKVDTVKEGYIKTYEHLVEIGTIPKV